MKLFKKLFALVFVLMSFALVACGEKEKEDESNVFEEVASELLKDVDKTKVTENLELVKELNGVTIEWKSDNEAVISNEGVVTRGETDEMVTLTITLTKGDDSEEFTISLIVPAKEKEDSSYQKVEDALKGTVGATYEVKGVVAAVNAQSFLLSDATGYILVYKGYGWSADVEAGDEVVVNGITTTYAGANQFDKTCTYEKKGTKGFTAPEAKELDGAKVTEIAGKTGTTVEYVKVKGTLNVSSDDKYFNLTIAGTENVGSITYPADVDFVKGFNGQEIEVTGFYTGISGGKYFNIMYTKIEGASGEPEDPKTPAETVTGTVNDALTGNVGDPYEVKGVVAAVNAQSFLLSDETGLILVYKGYDWTADVKAGDEVVVSGITTTYAGAVQFDKSCTYTKGAAKGYTLPTANELDGAKVTEIATKEGVTVEYVKVTGSLSVSSGKYYNLAIEGTEFIGSITYPADAEYVKGLDGKILEVTGFYTGISSSKYFNILYTDIQVVGEAPEESTPELPSVDAVLTATISFSNVANRTSQDGNSQVWEENGVKVTNNKGASTSNVADYADPARFYKSSDLIIEYGKDIKKVVIKCKFDDKQLQDGDTFDGLTLVVNGLECTLIADTPAKVVTLTKLPRQIRVTEIEIYC